MAAVETTNTAACAKCLLTTTAPELLVREQKSFRTGMQRVCPRCAAREQHLQVGVSFWVGIISLALLVGYLLLGKTARAEREDVLGIFLPMAVLVLATPVMLILHEAAHAIVGWVVGMRVFGVSLGSGRRMFRWRWKDRFLDVHAVLGNGVCVAAPDVLAWSRWPIILMIAAGPAVHVIAIALAICFALRAGSNWGGDVVRDCWGAFGFTNFIMLVTYLVPMEFSRDGQTLWSDGKQLKYLLNRDDGVARWIEGRYLLEILACLEMGRVRAAREWLEGARVRGQGSLNFRVYEFAVLAAEGKWKDVYMLAERWLTVTFLPVERAALAAWGAVAAIHAGVDLAQAERHCDEAMSVLPWDAQTQTVRALVSLAQGRLDESEAFMLRAEGGSRQWIARAAGAHIWVELCRRKGDVTRQRKWLKQAHALDAADLWAI